MSYLGKELNINMKLADTFFPFMPLLSNKVWGRNGNNSSPNVNDQEKMLSVKTETVEDAPC